MMVALCMTVKPHSDWSVVSEPYVCTVGSRNNHVCILWNPAATMCVYCRIPQQLCVCTVGSRNNHVCVLWDPQQPCACTVGSRNNHLCVLWDPSTTMCVYYGIPQQPRVCTMGSRSNHTQSRQHAHDTQPFFSGQASVREYWPGDQGSLGTFVRKRIRHPVFGEMTHTLIVWLGLWEGGGG